MAKAMGRQFDMLEEKNAVVVFGIQPKATE